MPNHCGRLSARRASITASDPYATHARPDRDVQSTSRLTIVRLAPAPTHPDPAPPPAASPRRIHRRLPSQPSPAPASPENTRLSFAFSSFGPGNAAGGPARAPSPSASPRLRASSPHRLTVAPTPHARLSPDQLLDLARSATSPVYASQPLSRSRPASPSLSHSPSHLHTHAPSTAATFTPLPDNIHLPFIDRPSEVAALISSPPSAKLFSLLAQTFPPQDAPNLSDPTKWSYNQLHNHLTQTTRQQFPDEFWVLQARKAILSHSELIWERVKGALGIPPELDLDYDHTQPLYFGGHLLDHLSSALSDGSADTDDIPDDHGRSARGHWEDWDVVMESPLFDRRSVPTSPEFPLSSASTIDAPANHLDHRPDDPVPPQCDPDRSGANSPSSFLSIEPLLFSTASLHAPPPIATPESAGSGLDDIQEGAEDEEESPSATVKQQQTVHVHDPDLISPSQIQGLRISTAPLGPDVQPSLPLNQAYSPPPPVSPLPPYPSQPRSRPVSGSYAHGPFKRTGSFSSLASSRSEPGPEADESCSESGRDHRTPLFPSSFANLNAGPTLTSEHVRRALHKRRTFSQSEQSGSWPAGKFAEHKRLSWGVGA